MKNRKVQYHKESKLWEYTIEAFECSCKCNVFHKEYDGKQRETYVFLTVLRCIVLLISLYVSYIYLTMTVDAFKGWM